MKGVILAGGKGTRLLPVTKIINKHLLPVGGRPMVSHSIEKLKEAGITNILIVTNREDISSFFHLFGDGSCFGVRLSYQVQDKPLGIADGIRYSRSFITGKFVVLLGDNIFADSLLPMVNRFEKQDNGARILLKFVEDPSSFGKATFNEQGILKKILEKPMDKTPSYCVTGVYMYDEEVFDLIDETAVSSRGEFEITDVNNLYVNKRLMQYDILKNWWIDAGTHESLYLANQYLFERL